MKPKRFNGLQDLVLTIMLTSRLVFLAGDILPNQQWRYIDTKKIDIPYPHLVSIYKKSDQTRVLAKEYVAYIDNKNQRIKEITYYTPNYKLTQAEVDSLLQQ